MGVLRASWAKPRFISSNQGKMQCNVFYRKIPIKIKKACIKKEVEKACRNSA